MTPLSRTQALVGFAAGVLAAALWFGPRPDEPTYTSTIQDMERAVTERTITFPGEFAIRWTEEGSWIRRGSSGIACAIEDEVVVVRARDDAIGTAEAPPRDYVDLRLADGGWSALDLPPLLRSTDGPVSTSPSRGRRVGWASVDGDLVCATAPGVTWCSWFDALDPDPFVLELDRSAGVCGSPLPAWGFDDVGVADTANLAGWD